MARIFMDTTITLLKNIELNTGKIVTVQGWVYDKRNLGGIIFLNIGDGTAYAQVVITRDNLTEFDNYREIRKGTVIKVIGVVNKEKSKIEISCKKLNILGSSNDVSTNSFINTLTDSKKWAVLRIKHEIIAAINDFLRMNDFVLAVPPLVLPDNGKKTGFSLDFYDCKALLSQSSALYMVAYALAFNRAYSVHPAFRAEKSNTKKHLAEFWMLEAEAVNANFQQIMDFTEELVIFVLKKVLQNMKRELELLNRRVSLLRYVEEPFSRVTYDKAVDELQSKGYQIERGKGLGKYERVISKQYNGPVFVTNYPIRIGSWTAKPCTNKTSLSFNLIAPEGFGEIVEGGERISNYRVYQKKFEMAGIDSLDWFVELNKYGPVLHSGFGLGIERLCMWLCGLNDIQDTVGFPRKMNKLYP